MKNYLSILFLLFALNSLEVLAKNDFTIPVISSLIPVNGATGVPINSEFAITFDQAITLGTGDIVIYNAADDTVFDTIDVTSPLVSISGTIATICTFKKFDKNKSYYIQIAATAFEDGSGDFFAGIADKTTWAFTTEVNTAPNFTSTPTTTIDEDAVNYSYTITASDINADVLDISATILPSWLTFNNNRTITDIAGSTAGYTDAIGTAAQFDELFGIVADKNDNFFVTERVNNRIRKINTTTGEVTTFAGDGTINDFNSPTGIAIDANGNVYVGDINNHRIQKITPDGVISTFAGSGVRGTTDGNGTSAQFDFPRDVSVDNNGNVYVVDAGSHRIRKITPSQDVTTIAGSSEGFAEGIGTAAQFKQPFGIEVDYAGNVYVSDNGNKRIRKIKRTNTSPEEYTVSTFAGTGSGPAVTVNGAANVATFQQMYFMTKDIAGNLYVNEGFQIRKITPAGIVSTFAPISPFAEGGFTFDSNGDIIFVDNRNDKIKRSTITSTTLTGTVTGQEGNHNVLLNVKDLFGGSTDQSFTVTVEVTRPTIVSLTPTDDATNVDPTANLQMTFSENVSYNGGDIIIYDASDDSVVETINSGTSTTGAVATIPVNNLRKGKSYYIQMSQFTFSDASNNRFVGISDKTTWNFATELNTAPTFTSTPVTTILEEEEYLYNITVNDTDGDPLIVTGTTIPSWLSFNASGVTTFAGSGVSGYNDATGTAAQFNIPTSAVEDSNGNLFIADKNNFRIRKITPAGVVSTFAGSGTRGDLDGTGTAANFQRIEGITIDSNDNLYVTTHFVFGGNHSVRKITPAAIVTTLAGGARGFNDATGTTAEFSSPQGIVFDGSGNLFIADRGNNRIRKIDITKGVVTTVAGSGNSGNTDGTGTSAEFNFPLGITIDSSGNLFVADRDNSKIRKITPSGVVTTFAGSGNFGDIDATGTSAEFGNLTSITIDANDNLYVMSSNKIKKITPTAVVTTIAGGSSGFMDGTIDDALFDSSAGLTIDSKGIIIISDGNNHRIRKLAFENELKGTPTPTDVGSHSVTLNVTDDLDANIDQTFTINVNARNVATSSVTGMWSNPAIWGGTLPTSADNIVIANGSTVTVDVTNAISNKLTVNSGGTLIIDDEKAVTIDNSFENNGTVTVNSSATNSGVLFIKGTASGNINYVRGGLTANEWSVVTVPVSGQQIEAFALNATNDIRVNTTPDPDRYAIGSYNDANATGSKWEYYDASLTTETFALGESYAMSRGTDGSVTFTGSLTISDVAKAITSGEWNAIGNPFTTFIPANKNSDNNFIQDNFIKFDTSNVAIYVWDNTQNKYIAISMIDAIQTSLPPGQGFFVRAKPGATSFEFKQDKRSVQPFTGNTSFSKSSGNYQPKIKLMVTKGAITVNTKIMYFDTATTGLDAGYDVGNFRGSNFDVFTHLVNNSSSQDFTIQSLPTSNYENMIVPVGIKATADSEITFSAETLNLPKGINTYLEDKETGAFIQLDYLNKTFTITLTSALDGVGRFYLHTTSKVLNVDVFNEELANLQIFLSDENKLSIHNLPDGNNQLKIFDLVGKEILKSSLVTEKNQTVFLPKMATGIYIVNLKTKVGNVSKKIIVN